MGNSLGSSVASFGQNEDEFEKARQQMMRSDGRDFLEESTIAEAARQEMEREVLKEARSGLSQNSGSQASMLYGSDTRGELASDDKVLHRQRCAVFTCEGILEQADSECVVCECPRSELGQSCVYVATVHSLITQTGTRSATQQAVADYSHTIHTTTRLCRSQAGV